MLARHMFCYVAKTLYKSREFTLSELAAFINRDHTTVLASVRQVNDWLATDDEETVIAFAATKEHLNYKTVYISGKVTGMEKEAASIFSKASKTLLAKGMQVVNPLCLNHDHDKSWHSYMRVCLKALCDCDAIYMLPNWTDSKGAIIEHTVAQYLGLETIYEPIQ